MGKINYRGIQKFKKKFLKIGATKLKEDIFVELQSLIKDVDFIYHLNIPK